MSKKRVFALIDCNNFYVSCERVFRPDLIEKPVVCLSNNDGCVISRSAEAKRLGIKMGEPWFKLNEFAAENGITAFSSNYLLYQHFSDKVMQILADFSSKQEVYSIDECFLELTHLDISDLHSFAQAIRTRVKKWSGIPVCVGIAHTKTLAKLANHIAKSNSYNNGVFDMTACTDSELDSLLSNLSTNEVWGVGKKHQTALSSMGIDSVAQLKALNPMSIKKQFSVVLARTVMELNDVPTIDLDTATPIKKQIMASRSFGTPVESVEEVQEALCQYVSNAAVKLREQRSIAGGLSIFIMTNRFNSPTTLYSNSITIPLPFPTDDTLLLANAACSLVNVIFKSGFKYAKAGVCLVDIQPNIRTQYSLFESSHTEFFSNKRQALMQAVDNINLVWGRGTIDVGTVGLKAVKKWNARSDKRSPNYTSRWDDIPIAKT